MVEGLVDVGLEAGHDVGVEEVAGLEAGLIE